MTKNIDRLLARCWKCILISEYVSETETSSSYYKDVYECNNYYGQCADQPCTIIDWEYCPENPEVEK